MNILINIYDNLCEVIRLVFFSATPLWQNQGNSLSHLQEPGHPRKVFLQGQTNLAILQEAIPQKTIHWWVESILYVIFSLNTTSNTLPLLIP